jgi:hypothetical protein
MLDRTGQLDISVQTDPFPRSVVLQITIPEGEPAIILTPTPLPTLTPTPTPTPTSTPVPTEVPEETPVPTPGPATEEVEQAQPTHEIDVLDLVLALLSVLVTSGIGYYVVRLNHEPVSRAMRVALWCVIGGLALYIAYVLRLPGFVWLREWSGRWAAGWAALLGGIVPLIVVGIVRQGRRWV